MKNRKRKRVSRDDVRNNAKQGPRGGQSWFKPGVDSWAPEKAGTYPIDVVPYEVTDPNHPDGIEPGYLWYKRSFVVHHNVGPNSDSVVCPLSYGSKRCPIHEERARLQKAGDADEKVLKDLNGQTFVAMNMLDPDNPKKTKVFAMSYGKFMGADAGLQTELESGREEVLNFFDTEGGKTIQAKFKEADFQGRSFLKCVRIDFVDREDLDEEKTLKRTTNLDEMFNKLDYEKLKAMFLQEEDEDEDRPRKAGKKKGKPRDEDEEDDSDDGEDDEEETPKKTGKGKKKASEDDDEDDSSDDEDEEEDDDEDEEEDDSSDDEDDSSDEEEEDDRKRRRRRRR